jgi:hypothetical protein
MSYLLFMDESGHDHKHAPYEVRGGIAIHASKPWDFVQNIQSAEEQCFGIPLSRTELEIKGSKLLEKRRFRWAAQQGRLNSVDRRTLCRSFLEKNRHKISPSRAEFTAFGQASIEFCTEIFRLLRASEASLFASVVDPVPQPRLIDRPDMLRKDHVFLFERYFYFLAEREETGLIVLDETDRDSDADFISRMERYFVRATPGQLRASRIVPVPLFVDSQLARPIQAADVCIYALNWGYRIPRMMNCQRDEVRDLCSGWLGQLQVRGNALDSAGNSFTWWSVVYL